MAGWELVVKLNMFGVSILLVMVSGFIVINTHFTCADVFLLYDIFIPEI